MSDRLLIEPLVRAALIEDLGRAGDITSTAIVAPHRQARAEIAARRRGRIAGLDAALTAFMLMDPRAVFDIAHADGTVVEAGAPIAVVRGNARALLAAERTALNLLGRMCGIATMTAAYVEAVRGTRARIVCTRKTTPGLRFLEKEAVRLGGGHNHRFGLDDAVLIKDNHIVIAGGVAPAIRLAREDVGHLVKIEVEVDTLAQLDEALAERADIVLLDNMSPDHLRRAVARTGGRAVLEASGSVTLESVRAIAESGVDLISVGALTHSVENFDVGLDFRADD